MFGLNRRSNNEEILSLQLHETASGNKRTTITRNRNPRGRKQAGMNLYHRADQILMRFRVSSATS